MCVEEGLRAGLWKSGAWAWGFAAVVRVGEERSICVRILRDVWSDISLRVEFLLKTDSGYSKEMGVNTPWQTLGIPFAITPLGHLHQSPPSPIPENRARGKRRGFSPEAFKNSVKRLWLTAIGARRG